MDSSEDQDFAEEIDSLPLKRNKSGKVSIIKYKYCIKKTIYTLSWD